MSIHTGANIVQQAVVDSTSDTYAWSLRPELRPGRHIQQQLGPGAHRLVPAVEQNLPNLLANSGIAWVSKAADRHPLPLEPLGQEFGVRTLAAAVRAVEHNELALESILQRRSTFNHK